VGRARAAAAIHPTANSSLFREASQLALLALTVAALASLGCGTKPLEPLPPPVVATAVVERISSARDLRMSGTVEAERTTSLSFAVPGTVEAVLVDDGETIRRGQVLARLTAVSYDNALGIAAAQAARAEDAVRRLEPMHRNKTVPEIKWVEAETSSEAARHAVEIARKNLADTVLRAPEDGVVSRRLIEPGATVAPGVPAFQVVQTRIVRAIAPVPENQIGQIRAGQPARVAVAALGREFAGEVYEIGVLADPLTRTYPVKITLDNGDGALKVGMVVDAFLPLPGDAPALAVPREAVRIDEKGAACVFVVGADTKVERRQVEVIGFVGERTALAGGVQEGEQVVVSGTPMLADGTTVRLAEAGARRLP
jgi:RND family efflux transporter MFP subunit